MIEEKTKLLELRRKQKKRQPLFVSRDARLKPGVPFHWRKPRGKHSPVRQSHKGKQKLVTVGYGSPKAVRGLDRSGLEKVIVNNRKELENINSEHQGVIISKKVGSRKKAELIKLALEKKLTLLNLKEPQAYLEKIDQVFQKRKELKKKKETAKEKKEAEKRKKAAEKEQEAKKEEAKEKTETETAASQPVEEKTEGDKQKLEAEKTIIKKQ